MDKHLIDLMLETSIFSLRLKEQILHTISQ